MSFIRAKEIPPRSGNWYDYEVRTVHEGKRVIQEYIRYIGKSGSSTHLSGGGSASRAITTSHTPKSVNPSTNDIKIPKMKTPARQIASAMGMYYGGMSLDAIQQQFKQDCDLDMSESNYIGTG